jgi:hypothetical protein
VEIFGRLFPPEVLLPEQQDARFRRFSDETLACLRLWIAVMAMAVLDVGRFRDATRPREKRIFEETVSWIEDDAFAVGSFRWLCELLGFDPPKAREAILRYTTPAQRRRARRFIKCRQH